MKKLDKRVFAVALSFALSGLCGSLAFADGGSTFKSLANAAAFSGGGGYSFSGSVGASLGADNAFMRRGQSLSGGETTEQINEVRDAEENAARSVVERSVPANDRTFWATPYYSSFSGCDARDVNVDEGGKFKAGRVGVLSGVRKTYSPELTADWLVGWSKSSLSQSAFFKNGGNPGDYVEGGEISLTDFQFGADFKYRFESGVYAIFSAIGGAEDYRWTRRWRDGSIPDEAIYKGGTTGNTLVVDLKLVKNYELDENWSITPSVGVESSNSWIFKASEAGETKGAGMSDWQAWELTKTLHYGRVTGRVGADLSYADDDGGYMIGAYYGTQIGGIEAARISIAPVADPSSEITVSGEGFGRDSLDCNAGLWTYLNDAKTSRISGLYSIRMYSRATSQVLGGTYSVEF